MDIEPIWIVLGGIIGVIILSPIVAMIVNVTVLEPESEYFRGFLMTSLLAVVVGVFGLLELNHRRS